jgi:hypothetical protein
MPDEWQHVEGLHRRIAELEAAIAAAPDVPFGMLANDPKFRERMLKWHDAYASWQFNFPAKSKT